MMKKFSIYQILIFVIAIIIFFYPIAIIGQNLISADPSDALDSEAIFINPAVISIQPRQVTLGMKVYQLGFLRSQELGIHTSFFSLSLPDILSGLMNIGLTGQNFSVPLYDQTNFSLIVAKRPFERLSLGLRYNLFTKSYHRKYFDLVNPVDPVFANGTVKMIQSFSAGLMVFPWSTLAVGFACDNLNHPDVSLGQDQFRQPLAYDFGIRYSHTYFSSSIYFNYFQQHWQVNWIFESRPSASSIFKIGFVQQAARFNAQFQLVNGLSINYIFDFPIYDVNELSKGSHQIGFLYNLDYKDRIKALQFTNYNEGKFPIFNLPSQFFAEISSDNLEIVSQKIVRTVDDEIVRNALKNLTKLELALHDTTHNLDQFFKHGLIMDNNVGGFFNSAKYLTTYEEYLKKFTQNVTPYPVNSIDLIAEPGAMLRAHSLRDSLVNRCPFLDQHIRIKQCEADPITKRIEPQTLPQFSTEISCLLNPELVYFQIVSLKMRRYQGWWKLIITDYEGRDIKVFSGKGNVPDELSWDWRDNNRNLITPDIYYYYLEWEGKNGQKAHSQPKTFTVTKISRTLEIDIRAKPDKQKDQGATIEIKLAN